MSFTYNGTRKDWITANKIRRPYQSNRVLTLLRVPSMPGGHLKGVEDDPLVIPVRIEISGESRDDYFNKAEELALWFDVKEPAPLIFDDRPNRTYFAVVQGTMSPEEIVKIGYVEVQFVCPDPYKYGPEKMIPLTTDLGTTFNIEGTAETKPIFEFDVTAPITYAMIQNHLNEYMMIGQPIDVESQVPFQKYERVFSDPMSSLTPWSIASSSDIDGGVVAGNIISRSGRFIAESYGIGSAWHGPALKRGLTEPLKDFRLEVELDFFNNLIAHAGRVEVYLKDVLGQDVCKIAFKDVKSGSKAAVAEIRAGGIDGHYLANKDNSKSWNDINGVLRIEREGTTWKAYVARIRDGKHSGRLNVEWSDRKGSHTAKVAQIVVHLGQIGTYAVPDQGLKHITIDKIHQEPDGVPYIAGPGDKITFNFLTRELLINGENRKDLKTDLGGRYFTFKPGQNTIALSPNAISGISKYRPAYK